MKYLFWSSINLESGLGGVETHVRSLARELRKLGVQIFYSTDPQEPWSRHWDVIHTHGSMFYGPRAFVKGSEIVKQSVWVHTLHGWTHERVAACREYFWPRAYSAIFNEYVGASKADHVFVVHDNLSFLQKLKSYSVCSNGWDSWGREIEEGPFYADVKGSWLFVGRGNDPVKGSDNLRKFSSQIKLAAAPGNGFEADQNVVKLGKLSPAQIKIALMQSEGLVLTSLYEGLPLVVLEALALGTLVISTRVGGLKTLPPDLKGLYFCRDDLLDLPALCQAAGSLNTPQAKLERSEHNKKLLKTWQDVSQHVFAKIIQIQAQKRLVNVH